MVKKHNFNNLNMPQIVKAESGPFPKLTQHQYPSVFPARLSEEENVSSPLADGLRTFDFSSPETSMKEDREKKAEDKSEDPADARTDRPAKLNLREGYQPIPHDAQAHHQQPQQSTRAPRSDVVGGRSITNIYDNEPRTSIFTVEETFDSSEVDRQEQ